MATPPSPATGPTAAAATSLPLPLEPKPQRLVSLDAFRGATIAGMILVNNPGSWQSVYAPLRHADWHGVTPTDWVFPFFLFIVGVAIPFSQAKRHAPTGTMVGVILRRSAILFALGLLLASVPYNSTSGILNLSTLRIPGVLQRIAICYLVVATLALFVRWRAMAWIGAAVLAAYTAMMLWGGDLSREGNLAHKIDVAVFGKHGYGPYNDPEGLLSTLGSIGTVICGWLVGVWLRRPEQSAGEKIAAVMAFGVVGVCVGVLMHHAVIPMNKQIWTASFTIYTAGLGCLGLGLSYWLIDIVGYRRWAAPLVAMGMNAITIFVLAGIVGRLMAIPMFSGTRPSGEPIQFGLKTYLYDRLFVPTFSSQFNASLAWALAFVAGFTLLALAMHRARIYIKV